jgi:hypothetical protein
VLGPRTNNNFICIYMFMEAVIPMFGRLINLINLSVKEKDHTLKAFWNRVVEKGKATMSEMTVEKLPEHFPVQWATAKKLFGEQTKFNIIRQSEGVADDFRIVCTDVKGLDSMRKILMNTITDLRRGSGPLHVATDFLTLPHKKKNCPAILVTMMDGQAEVEDAWQWPADTDEGGLLSSLLDALSTKTPVSDWHTNPLVAFFALAVVKFNSDHHTAMSETSVSAQGAPAAGGSAHSFDHKTQAPTERSALEVGKVTHAGVKHDVLIETNLHLISNMAENTKTTLGKAYSEYYEEAVAVIAGKDDKAGNAALATLNLQVPPMNVADLPPLPFAVWELISAKFMEARLPRQKIPYYALRKAGLVAYTLKAAMADPSEIQHDWVILCAKADMDAAAVERPLTGQLIKDEKRYRDCLVAPTSIVNLQLPHNAAMAMYFESVMKPSNQFAYSGGSTQVAFASGGSQAVQTAYHPTQASPPPTQEPVMTQDEMIQKVASAAAKAAAEETKKKLASEFKAIREGQEKSQADALKYQAEQQKQLSDMKSNLSSVSKKVNQQQQGRGGQNNATNPQ